MFQGGEIEEADLTHPSLFQPQSTHSSQSSLGAINPGCYPGRCKPWQRAVKDHRANNLNPSELLTLHRLPSF